LQERVELASFTGDATDGRSHLTGEIRSAAAVFELSAKESSWGRWYLSMREEERSAEVPSGAAGEITGVELLLVDGGPAMVTSRLGSCWLWASVS
jgi:hypothetical protein